MKNKVNIFKNAFIYIYNKKTCPELTTLNVSKDVLRIAVLDSACPRATTYINTLCFMIQSNIQRSSSRSILFPRFFFFFWKTQQLLTWIWNTNAIHHAIKILKQLLANVSRQVEKIIYSNTMRNAVQVGVAELKSEIWICLMLSSMFACFVFITFSIWWWICKILTSVNENIKKQVKFKATISSSVVIGKISDRELKQKSSGCSR